VVSRSPATPDQPRERPTLVQLAPLVDAALAEYGIVAVEVASLRYYNNATYRVVAQDGAQYALRVTSNHYSELELGCEMQWLSVMQGDPEVRVPAPVTARDGRLVVSATAPTLAEARSCTLCHWLEGAHIPEERMTAADFACLGAAASKLHRQSASFVPSPDFERPRWDEARWFDPRVHDTYQRILEHLRRFFSPSAVERFHELAQKSRTRMRELRSTPRGFGLIHADFHAGNYLFHDGRVGFIDFEDLGWGYFLYDVATALFGAIERPDYPVLVDAFCSAYAGNLALPESFADDLLVFQVMRAVFLTSLVITRNSLAESAWWEGYVVGKLRRLLGAVPVSCRLDEL
jgi:Ser/Thr protein kinase RdoA (MazF antagonist)